MAAVVIEMTLDLVMATSFSRGSVLVDSSAVVSVSDEVRRFSLLKLLDFSKRLVRLESDLFFVRWDVIASFDDCRFSEPTADVAEESAGFLVFVLDVSLLSVDFSRFRLVDGVRFRLVGSLFRATVFLVANDGFLRLLLASFFGRFGVLLVLLLDFIALLLLLFVVFRIDDRS